MEPIVRRWAVVSTRPNQEARAQVNLARQGFTVWLPSYRRKRRHAGRTDIVKAPLFPGYLFVELDAERESWHSINGTFGVRNLVCLHDRPAFLPDGFIADLRASANDDGLLEPPEPKLAPGQTVTLTDGPFAGNVAKLLALDGKGRVLLLLELLGGEVRTTIAADAVAAVP
jgi:transcriptional antiterminator RfaH